MTDKVTKTVSTNHNLFEEKGEPKRYRTEVLPLTSLKPYREAKPAHEDNLPLPPPPKPLSPFSPSLISLMVSVDVKHHVYLLTTPMIGRGAPAQKPTRLITCVSSVIFFRRSYRYTVSSPTMLPVYSLQLCTTCLSIQVIVS